MSKPLSIVDLSATLHLSEYPATSGHKGFWLYDDTRRMNLAMRSETPQDALLEAIEYYQGRCLELEAEVSLLQKKVDAVVAIFAELEEVK